MLVQTTLRDSVPWLPLAMSSPPARNLYEIIIDNFHIDRYRKIRYYAFNLWTSFTDEKMENWILTPIFLLHHQPPSPPRLRLSPPASCLSGLLVREDQVLANENMTRKKRIWKAQQIQNHVANSERRSWSNRVGRREDMDGYWLLREGRESLMISEYGLAATLLIIYEDRNWENIIYLQARQVPRSSALFAITRSSVFISLLDSLSMAAANRQGMRKILCALLICSAAIFWLID